MNSEFCNTACPDNFSWVKNLSYFIWVSFADSLPFSQMLANLFSYIVLLQIGIFCQIYCELLLILLPLEHQILWMILTLDTMLCHFMYSKSYCLSLHVIFKNSVEEKCLSLSICEYISPSCQLLLVQYKIWIRNTNTRCCVEKTLVSRNPPCSGSRPHLL